MNFHIGITGSVLLAGSSEKDLDVIIYPMNRVEVFNYESARRLFRSREWKQIMTIAQVHRSWRGRGSDDTKHVESWKTHDGRRVDIFYLS